MSKMYALADLKAFFEPLGFKVMAMANHGYIHTLWVWMTVPDRTKPPIRATSAGKTIELPGTKIICSYEWKFGRHSTPHVRPDQLAAAVKELKAQRNHYRETGKPITDF